MKTKKYEIELPVLPDGFELVGPGKAIEGDITLAMDGAQLEWCEVDSGSWRYYLARRREPLSDWANKQRLFQALAEMRTDPILNTTATGCAGDAWWNIGWSGGEYCKFNMGVPPSSGTLNLENGKWVDE